jgi:hypothetical protein
MCKACDAHFKAIRDGTEWPIINMLQEPAKTKGIKKSRSGHPKVSIPKNSNPRTKRTARNEPSAPLSKYTKLIKYKTY